MAVTERVPVATPERLADVRRTPRGGSIPWRIIGFAGSGFALLGWTDALLLWYPLRIGMPDWEFATVSGMFDALPLATIGALLVVAWLLVEGRRPGRLLVGTGLVVVVIGLCAAFVLFALSFATGLGAVDGDTQWLLVRAGIKTTVAAFVYVTLHILMALSLFRATRKDRPV